MQDEAEVLKDHATNVSEMFGQHFVDLHLKYKMLKGEHAGKQVNQHVSAFFLTARGHWHLITAGHVLEQVDGQLERGEIGELRARLIDTFGPNRVTDLPTPFAYERAVKVAVNRDDLGLDFGLIPLSEWMEALMKANGTRPFSENDWIKQPQEFERYFMMGVPAILNPALDPSAEGELRWSVRVVHKVDGPPPGIAPTVNDRFWGRINPSEKVPDIKGMSGGPIFGLAKDKDGNLRYWPVAIQSGWFKESGIVAATPVVTVGMMLDRFFREYVDDEVEEEVASTPSPGPTPAGESP